MLQTSHQILILNKFCSGALDSRLILILFYSMLLEKFVCDCLTSPKRSINQTYFVMATAISYTGSRRSRNKYFPMSVRAAAESIASRPTRFRSKYGVASLPYIFQKEKMYMQYIQYIYTCLYIEQNLKSLKKCKSRCLTIMMEDHRLIMMHRMNSNMQICYLQINHRAGCAFNAFHRYLGVFYILSFF